MKKKILIFAIMIAVSSVMFTGCGDRVSTEETTADETVSEVAVSFPYRLGTGITVTEIRAYSGAFVEDGSGREVQNVMALTVKNDSGKNFQLMEIEVVADGEKYNFSVTTLTAGAAVTALEKSGKTYDENAEITDVSIIRDVEFASEVTVHPDMFEITAMDTVFNIKNISDTDFENPVYVYYKIKTENGYFGGITYRAKTDSVRAGELKQISASHFDIETCEVVFVTFTS